jgi:hypothetical protein
VLPCVDVFVADEFCVWPTILRTCLALRCGAQIADVRWAAQLADVPCVADVRWAAQLADVPCVADVRWAAQRALGRPTCGRASRLRCGRASGRPTCGRAVRPY